MTLLRYLPSAPESRGRHRQELATHYSSTEHRCTSSLYFLISSTPSPQQIYYIVAMGIFRTSFLALVSLSALGVFAVEEVSSID